MDAASSCAPWPGDPGNTQQIKPLSGNGKIAPIVSLGFRDKQPAVGSCRES